MNGRRLLRGLLLLALVASGRGACPWKKAVPELNNMCLCVDDEESKLSIQCNKANFPLLMTSVHKLARTRKIELLYVNDTDIGVLNSRIFEGLHVINIQFSYCRIYNISDQAFTGLQNSLENLNLQGNQLDRVPSAALAELQRLQLLDLSDNQITRVPDGSFATLSLVTLKIGENALFLSDQSFVGLEKSLKNLNLKGAGLEELPTAIQPLEALAFLDLAQNEIRNLAPGAFQNLQALAALNLERNLLQQLHPDTFIGVNDTLSSLSLLNNLISVYPSEAINSLPQLRVLDIGFNLLEIIPEDAFRTVRSLTLLALDGNQLKTVPEEAFQPLSESLKGLSIGGKFLHCDCRIAWVLDWINNKGLQVTSRERNPQFCGSPAFLRNRSFYQVRSEELPCNKTSSPSTFSVTSSVSIGVVGPDEIVEPPNIPSDVVQDERPAQHFLPNRRKLSPLIEATSPLPPVNAGPLPPPETNSHLIGRDNISPSYRDSQDESQQANSLDRRLNVGGQKNELSDEVKPVHRGSPSSNSGSAAIIKRKPQLVRHPDSIEEENSQKFSGLSPHIDEVIIQDAYRKDNSVIIQWDSEVSNILGFRVVYRLFGDKQFKLGPPLASSEREFKIRNVPTRECIVVCVVSLEDINVTPENVPYPQCREIRTDDSTTPHMDTIIIAASSAICGTVIIAVIIFICCNRRRSSGRHSVKDITISQAAAPLASLGTLGGGGVKADWDTLSMYSQRSIPRARMYHMDKGNINGGFVPDDVQSHISAASMRPHSRALAEGQFGPLAQLSLSRPDLRMSRQSIAGHQMMGMNGLTPGMMGLNGMGLNPMANMGRMSGHFSRAASSRSRHSRTSKSRDRATSSRHSHAGSSHSLTGYDSDGWTDHDMDIYVARNPTRNGGLVQL